MYWVMARDIPDYHCVSQMSSTQEKIQTTIEFMPKEIDNF